MTTSRLVVIGNANVDLTTYGNRAPERGETVMGTNFAVGMGGKGANQAVAAARAGALVSFIGRVGEDAFGDMIQEALGKEGLQLAHLKRVPGPSGVASIFVEDKGANRIAVFTGASATLDSSAATAAIAAHENLEILVSQLEIHLDTVAAALRAATARGALTILNTAPAAALSPEILENTGWLIANEVEIATVVTGAGLPCPVEPTADTVRDSISGWGTALSCSLIVTLGDQGAVGWAPGDEVFHFRHDPVVALDTVGAGDCFVGYFAALVHEGLPWQQALAGGVLAASESVQKLGAQVSYPKGDQAQALLDTAKRLST